LQTIVPDNNGKWMKMRLRSFEYFFFLSIQTTFGKISDKSAAIGLSPDKRITYARTIMTTNGKA